MEISKTPPQARCQETHAVPFQSQEPGTQLATMISEGLFMQAMAEPPSADRTLAVWGALAGEITNIVMEGGVPHQGKAAELGRMFQAIDQYCNSVLYENPPDVSQPDNPLAEQLLKMPGIELFAKQATQVLEAIENNTDGILAEGFMQPDENLNEPDTLLEASGYGSDEISPSEVSLSSIIQGTTGKDGVDHANVNCAILKTLLTPHRQRGLDSCAIDSTIISETINHPARMAGMYKGLLLGGAAITPAGEKIPLQEFAPFLAEGTFAGNEAPFPVTNLDSALFHGLACMLYGENDVSDKSAAYKLAASMPMMYLGIRKQDLEQYCMDLTKSGAITIIATKAGQRTYIPGHFDPEHFNHGQNFVVVGISESKGMVYVDTNWIDPDSGCPIYMKIPTGQPTPQNGYELCTVNFSESLHETSLEHKCRIKSGMVFIMPDRQSQAEDLS